MTKTEIIAKIEQLEAKAEPLRQIDHNRIVGTEYALLCDYIDQLNALYRQLCELSRAN